MDDHMYGLRSTALMSPDNLLLPSDNYQTFGFRDQMTPMFGSDELLPAPSAILRGGSGGGGGGGTGVEGGEQETLSVIKAKIASHPTYPRLLEAYIDCQKVGAPPEIACLLDEIRRENDLCNRNAVSTCLGVDPELDEFMETYCKMLFKYKSDVAGPFVQASSFLNSIKVQLNDLCKSSSIRSFSDEGGVSSDEERSGGEVEISEAQRRQGDGDLKARLLHRFGNQIPTLKLEFSKKKKKGKLPREARQALLEWWDINYKWPYPTEADKIALAERTGLNQKQINNWFINQRKRHWKPSENLQCSSTESLSGHVFVVE